MALKKIQRAAIQQIRTVNRTLTTTIEDSDVTNIVSLRVTDAPVGWECIPIITAYIQATGASARVKINNDGNVVAFLQLQESVSGSGFIRMQASSVGERFTVTNALITVDTDAFGTGDALYGSNVVSDAPSRVDYLFFPPGSFE